MDVVVRERDDLGPLEQTEEMVARIRDGAGPRDSDALTVPASPSSESAAGEDAPAAGAEPREDVYATAAWPSSPSPGPRLVRIVEFGREAEAFLLDDERTVIGREEGDLSFPDDAQLSTPHAAVRRRVIDLGDGRTETRCVLEDLGSERGVFVRIRHSWPLREGHVFMVGEQLFRADAD